jgi:hypothetical protein
MVPHISRYLGTGTELSFAALKNQVSQTTWVGGDAFPVHDIHWIAKQYYYDLTGYAGLPANQETIDERFVTSSNFWSARTEKNHFFTVEDEAYNMFEILRDFSTRTTEQGFINVISAEYLLKEYMADNAGIFETDPKAIPCIVADYTRSNRNTVLRLLLMMSSGEVPAALVERELGFIGIAVSDLQKQLWYELYRCYAGMDELATLPGEYAEAVEVAATRKLAVGGAELGMEILHIFESFNLKRGEPEVVCTLTDKRLLSVYVASLRSAGYVAEDEKGSKHYLGAELAGHIYQKYLPGQFFTFGGKYYEMQYLTADGQVLVRRAADHITDRRYYRQLRHIRMADWTADPAMGSSRTVSDIEITRGYCNLDITTEGYLELESGGDIKGARRVLINNIPQRS